MAKSIVVVTPVFNDWESFGVLAGELSGMAAREGLRLRILAVDDGSSTKAGEDPLEVGRLAGVEVIQLVCNLGHQRAIAIGLVEASKMTDIDGVVVMDCDGEDRVEDIPRLLSETSDNPNTVVVATRASRSEGIVFRMGYAIYKRLFHMLVGTRIDFGNFAFIPAASLGSVVHSAGIWNHLAASICRSRLPLVRKPCPRGVRYAGQSKMNFSSLLVHGLGAMSVYVDMILARIITSISGFVGLLMLAILAVIVVRFSTGLAIPGWATNAIGLLAILLLQSFIFVFTSVFMLLNLRTMKTVIPAMDAPHYIDKRFELPIRGPSDE